MKRAWVPLPAWAGSSRTSTRNARRPRPPSVTASGPRGSCWLAPGGLPPGHLVLEAGHPVGGVDDEALVGAFARLVQLVAHVDTESEPPAIHLGQLDGDRHRHADRCRRQVRDV